MARHPGRRAPSAALAVDWTVSRFQRFCRFAAREILTSGKAFRQRAFALKSVNVINERHLRKCHKPHKVAVVLLLVMAAAGGACGGWRLRRVALALV